MQLAMVASNAGAVLCGLGAGVLLGQSVGIFDRARWAARGAAAAVVVGVLAWIGAVLSVS